MENIHLSEGVSIEELDVKALKIFEENQTAFVNGFVKYQPSGQVINKDHISYHITVFFRFFQEHLPNMKRQLWTWKFLKRTSGFLLFLNVEQPGLRKWFGVS